MKTIPVSSKYQVVIPKSARKIMGITRSTQAVYIKRVTPDEIVLAMALNTEDLLISLLESTPKTKTNAVDRVNKLRDEWK